MAFFNDPWKDNRFFLAPEGELLKCMVWFNVRLSWNELENVDLQRHIIYQNDPLTKPDFMPVFPDPYLRHRRRQGHRRLSRHHPEPQGPSYMAIINIKMILWSLTLFFKNRQTLHSERLGLSTSSGAPRQADFAWLFLPCFQKDYF